MSYKLQVARIFLIFAAFVFCGFFVFTIALGVANGRDIIYGVKMGYLDVGDKNFDEFAALARPAVDDFISQKITLKIEGAAYETDFKGLGVDIDIEKSFQKAKSVGRGSSFRENIFNQIKTFLWGENIGFAVSFNDEKIEEYLKTFKPYEIAPQDASVYFDDVIDDFDYLMSFDGKSVSREKLKNDLAGRAEFLDGGADIDIVFAITEPEITDEMARRAVQKSRELWDSAPEEIRMNFNGDIFFLANKEMIGSWISARLEAFFDEAKISGYLTQISPSINEEPKDAILAYKNKMVEAFQLSSDGKRLNIEKSAADVAMALQSGEMQMNLVIDIIKPQISTDQIENLGLTSLLATGWSDFSGSSQSRVHNIKVGAAKFNGILLSPGEEFSFNKILGDVNESTGYLAGQVIKNHSVTYDYGGGVCQVSTTAFRAAILAGLEITERYPHSFPVKFYNPQGFDAAVYQPSPDLKFVNNTPGNLLIQTKVKGNKLYFEFYGTSDGRKVVLQGPEEYDKKSNGALKARLTREIFDKDGNLTDKTVFQSNYASPYFFPVARNPYE